jgi:hypothetical protein
MCYIEELLNQVNIDIFITSKTYILFYFILFIFETKFQHIAQADLKIPMQPTLDSNL